MNSAVAQNCENTLSERYLRLLSGTDCKNKISCILGFLQGSDVLFMPDFAVFDQNDAVADMLNLLHDMRAENHRRVVGTVSNNRPGFR